MSYNFLRQARYIRNSFLCAHDTLDGYSSDFHVNGNVDGWDVYNNIYLYGCWNSILFGTAYDRDPYVSRSINLLPVAAEYYYIVKIMMKATNNNPQKVVQGLTTGRIQWTRIGDSSWDDTKQVDFDVVADDTWHLYTVNMGPYQWWQGDINNMRIYPFIDGWSGDEFAIKYIKISSKNRYACDNTQCSYYLNYSHPCPGGGTRGSCESGLQDTTYTTISGISDKLIVNIDGYGQEYFDLGNNENLTPIEMSKVVANKIASVNIGGYAYSEVDYSENDRLKIYSGTVGLNSSVEVVDSTGARALGFFDYSGNSLFTTTNGTDSVDGFDYASSRLLTSLEINKIVDGDKDSFAYIHNPTQYSIEGGRRDFNEIGTPRLLSSMSAGDYYQSLSNKGKVLIDLSHPISNNGKIKAIYLYGKIDTLSKIKILRPHNDGTFTVIYSLDMPTESSSYMYTKLPINYRVDCDILVSKGDIIGVYNADLYVGVTLNGRPDATFQQFVGDPSVGTNIEPTNVYSFGIAGFAMYARGDRWQTNVLLDIDLGDRINIEELNVYGKEDSGELEFNIASCLDLTWGIDTYGQSHYHAGINWLNGDPWFNEHLNITYGKSCLDDCIRTADNGQQGTSYTSGPNGMETYGDHAYFYCDGDAEWLYSFNCTGKTEYCWPYTPNSLTGYVRDPISFTLTFPYEFKTNIHKSIIYFKERDNFRSIELSYYMGTNGFDGNAYSDSKFMRVPSYTSILLDGIEYLPDSGDMINDYIFNNPTNQDVQYATGGVSDPINWREYRASLIADWNVLEHNFDSIECTGFRIYTNHHKSTKIMEMELYSKIQTNPSLLDNLSLSFSDYGDIWTDVFFEEINDNKISGFMGGAPRYIRLELSSATVFELNEIECLVGDQVKIPGCNDVVNLLHAPGNSVGNSTPISIENVYDTPFDLIVDIPREATDSENILFWSKLGSQDDIIDPQIGPGCRLYKNIDYDITNDNSQCAINVLAYGLNNIIDGKSSYINTHGEYWDYTENGTLSSGVSLDICNTNKLDIKQSVFEFDYSANTFKYWKVGVDDISGTPFSIYDIIPYYGDVILSVDDIYTYGSVGSSPLEGIVVSDGVDIPLDNNFGFETDGDYEGWLVNAYNSTGAQLDVQDGKMIVTSFGTTTGPDTYGVSTTRLVDTLEDFIWTCNFKMYFSNVDQMGHVSMYLYDTDYSERIMVEIGDWWVGSYNIRVRLYDESTYYYESSAINGDNSFTVVRHGSTLIFFMNGNQVWSGVWSTRSVNRLTTYFTRSNSYNPPAEFSISDVILTKAYGDGSAFGFDLSDDNDIPNKIKLFHSPTTSINQVSLYGSNDNLSYTPVDTSGNITINNQNWYQYFAIDLQKRHDLEIIRNYGTSTNKLWLSTSSNVDYSNSDVVDVNNVVWNNSTNDDVRWLRIKLLSGDGTTRYLRKIGIYPDITSAYCIGGGYNCEWTDIGTILSDYESSIDVAYNSVVTGTNNYFRDFYPDNAVNGIHTDYNEQSCWGFDDTTGDPYLEMFLGSTCSINKVVLYHGYNLGDSSYMNVDYNFSVSTTLSGENFTNVFSITSNSDFERTHIFDPVDAMRARITITNYNSGRLFILDPYTNQYEVFNGSFLREIEVYTYTDQGYINSEDWPVIGINLIDQFQITNHALVNKDVSDTDTDWDNSEDYFKYSDNVFDDPEKVAFRRSGSEVVAYSNSNSSGDMLSASEYIFDEDVYFAAGSYNVEWQAYYNQSESEISLSFDGPDIVELYAENISTTWASETGIINIPYDGFYTVKIIQHENPENHWGGRNIYIYRMSGLTKWVSVKRDTAENYSWDDDSSKYGKDYLTLVKVYGDTRYPSIEYPWWWQSTISDLSADYLIVKVGSKSLKIIYPASTDIDTLQFIEGDDFGKDVYFFAKDMLHFWLYIDDATKLDTTTGDVTFGIINDAEPAYYSWYINSMSLSTGWNELNLKFENADYIYPIRDGEDIAYSHLNEDIDFRTNGRKLTSFRLRYRGIGYPFNMYIDDLKIQRNRFEDDVRFNKGLCLSGYDYLDIPLSGITIERGAIEFWVKLYTDVYGIDIFGDMNSRSLFTMINNNNDMISLGIQSGVWFAPNAGNVRKALNSFEIDDNLIPSEYAFTIGDVVHIAVVWSNDGKYLDNGDTIRLYIGGNLASSSKQRWTVDDTKSISIRLGGSNTQLALNQDTFGSAVFDNVKIYNYCKTDFNPNEENVSKDIVYTPNEFLQVSPDDVNFYGVGSDQLPLIFSQVPAGDSRTIYIRTNKNENFGRSKTTANLLISWLTTV